VTGNWTVDSISARNLSPAFLRSLLFIDYCRSTIGAESGSGIDFSSSIWRVGIGPVAWRLTARRARRFTPHRETIARRFVYLL